jgi:LacI family transcriptional regulator
MLKATITDIAREMGITPSTVSRALSGSPRVKEATRKAVEQKAREMGYEPATLGEEDVTLEEAIALLGI